MATRVPLMSTAELAARLGDEDLLVCDCRFAGDAKGSRAQYLTGRIPGAIHVYRLEDASAADTTITTFLPSPQEAADKLSRLGIAHEKTVVAYSDGGNLYASRLWHVLAHHGHEQVVLLDGGIEKWQAEGRPLECRAAQPVPGRFEPRESGSMRGIEATEILARLDDPQFRPVDVRDQAEFSGEQLRAARGGHTPGAVLWPWGENLRPDGTLLDPAEIRARATAAGLLPEHELVTYCQGGVRAAHAALALAIAGHPRVRIYDGSWPSGSTTRRCRSNPASPLRLPSRATETPLRITSSARPRGRHPWIDRAHRARGRIRRPSPRGLRPRSTGRSPNDGRRDLRRHIGALHMESRAAPPESSPHARAHVRSGRGPRERARAATVARSAPWTRGTL
jgi:thiosulfate/3-mercaptopyruvate sulfurtransferase